jgi:hypothetical protein
MAERFEEEPADSEEIRRAVDLEAKRIAYAAARVADHAERELFLLDRATHARDHVAARELESEADIAYRDLVALTEEHGLDG